MNTAMKNTAQYRRARTTTRPRCQRFTFKTVRDTEGEILYYLILPYLMIGNNAVEGFYRENYHLTLKTSGEIGICNTCAVGNPADECRWTLSGAITGMTVTNCGESVTLGVDLDEEIVAGVTAYGTDVWHVMPICLNVKTEYQRTNYTCGAASATMIYNYLSPNNQIQEAEYVSGIEGRFEVQKAYQDLDVNRCYLNELLGYDQQTQQFSYVTGNSSVSVQQNLSKSLNFLHPAIVHMKPISGDEPVWGYTVRDGHYIVVTGIYYDPVLDQYRNVVNDCHPMYSGIGGREIIVSPAELQKAMIQRFTTWLRGMYYF